MDRIIIDRLKIFANHGVFDFEKEQGQNFYISVTAYVDTQQAGLSDSLDNTVSYADVCDDIVDFNKNNCFNLIETLAEELAIFLLDKYKAIKQISIRIDKPEAPVEADTNNLSVIIERGRHRAYIAYGSNMGNSRLIIEEALNMLTNHKACSIKKKSSMVISKPYGEVEQDDFYNGVVELETYLKPAVLLKVVNDIEKKLGRVREIHWGPRTIDLDIIMYDDLIIDTEELTIPHSDMHNRDFVLSPLNEIAPYVRVPLHNKKVSELYETLKEHYIK